MEEEFTSVREGQVEVLFPKSEQGAFYSHVQEFNRDISSAVIRNYHAMLCEESKDSCKKVRILEALSASGLRSIRYAKEMGDIVDYVMANDLSSAAVASIKRNVAHNGLTEEKVKANHGDAMAVMYQAANAPERKKFDVIDIDPFGSASPFIDAAVQAVKDGGLLCVTCTDMAVLAGQYPETCFAKYGGTPLRGDHCHELALRLLLNSLQTSAARYKRQIVPLVSMSVDYYIRVFVRVVSSPKKVKETFTNIGMIYQCSLCKTHQVQALGTMTVQGKSEKFHVGRVASLAAGCGNCGCNAIHIGGPIYCGAIHDTTFLDRILEHIKKDESKFQYKTQERILGLVTVMREELLDVPLFYSLSGLASVVHCNSPSLLAFNSALLNAGYRVSGTHCKSGMIKTDAPSQVIWDAIRAWVKDNPVKMEKYSETSPTYKILSQPSKTEISFEKHPNANPPSRKVRLLRYESHEGMDWGPRSKKRKTAANAAGQ